MKGFVSAVIAGICMATLCPGETSAFEMSAGFKGGLSIAFLNGKEASPGDGWDSKLFLRFNGGAAVIMNFSPAFGVEINCLYSEKGMKAAGDGELTRQFAYLDIPVLARITNEGTPVRQSFSVGPFIGILQHAKETIAGSGHGHNGTVDLTGGMKPLDFGIVLCTATEIEAGPGSVIVEFRYSLGLSTVDLLTQQEKDNGFTAAEDIKTMALGIIAGYVFSF
jgi:hypothetical protein